MAARRHKLGYYEWAFRFFKRSFLPVRTLGVFFSVLILATFLCSNVDSNASDIRFEGMDQDVEIETLLENLGNDEFQVRQQAENRLREIGGPAIAALKRARMAGDSEIRFRARRLLVKIVREDYRQRLASFLASTDPTNEYGLDGWMVFSEIVGADEYARRLFVGMQKTSIDMFLSWNERGADFRRSVAQAVSFEEHSSAQPQHVYAMAAAMFGHIRMSQLAKSRGSDFASQPQLKNSRPIISPEAVSKISRKLNKYKITKLIETSGYQDCMDRLMTRWLKLIPDASNELLFKIQVVNTYRLNGFLSSALVALHSDDIKNGDLATAITIVANSKNAKQIGKLESLLDNSDTCFSFRDFNYPDVTHQVQVRDVALAALVYLSHQDYDGFGFNVSARQTQSNNETFISVRQCWLSNEQNRANAIREWKDFRAEAPLDQSIK